MQFSPEILKDHTAIIGKTGAGKSSTGKLMVEQVAPHDRVCILDPIKSDWWGLTSSADGKKSGLPFHILGGPRGHVPLHSGAGSAIGKLVGSGELRHSILDMSDFEAGGVQRFFCDFAQSLMRHQRGILYLFLEEAHEFAPKERTGHGHENMAIYYAKKLATAGRSKGLRLTVMTHSVQQLHNRILDSCETLIAHRLKSPASKKPVLDWLKDNIDDRARQQEIAASLSGLPTGTAWICTGDTLERRAFPKIKTFDNSATPDRDSAAQEVKTAPVDTVALRAAIGDAVAQAEADDPKKLRARIAELEAKARKVVAAPAPAAASDPQALERARAAGHADGHKAARGELAAVLNPGRHVMALNSVRDTLDAAARLLALAPPMPDPARAAAVQPQPNVALPRAAGAGDKSIPVGERAILICAAQYGTVERDQLSVLTGYKRSSRNAYVGRLRERGFVGCAGESVTITDEGVAALGSDYEPLPQGDALLSFWRAKLPVGERTILDVLIKRGTANVARDDLDEPTGYKRSSRNAYLSRLQSRRLVEFVGVSEVRASATLFA